MATFPSFESLHKFHIHCQLKEELKNYKMGGLRRRRTPKPLRVGDKIDLGFRATSPITKLTPKFGYYDDIRKSHDWLIRHRLEKQYPTNFSTYYYMNDENSLWYKPNPTQLEQLMIESYNK
jgi:hypothetical protein